MERWIRGSIRRGRHLFLLSVALFLAVGLVAAACGGDDADEEPAAAVTEAPAPAAEPEPAAEEPMAEEPMAEEMMDEEPMAEEPMAEEPMAEEPMAEEMMDEEPLRVAHLIIQASIDDEGYFLSHEEGVQDAAERLRADGGNVETALIQFIPPNEEFTQTTQQVIDDGYDIVIDSGAAGALFLDACAGVEGVACLETYGIPPFADNVVSYYPKHWHTAYLVGVAAGLLTETGTIGYVVTFDIPLVVANVNAYLLGCQSVREDCTLKNVTINSWFDPPLETEAAHALINDGADILFGFIDDATALITASERGVWAATMFKDLRRHGEDAYITSALMIWDEFYEAEFRAVREGTWSGNRQVLFELGAGAEIDSFGPNVPADVVEQVMQVRADIISGALNPFVGPFYDQDGVEQVPAGEALSDEFLYSGWSWYVQGVE